MPARSSWRIAAGECRRHPWRTLLVAQGMIWAIALIVIPAAVIGGSRRQALERAEELGTDLIQIEPSSGLGERAAPREEDLDALRAALGAGVRLSALRAEPLEAPVEGGEAWWLGIDSGFAPTAGRTLAAGRWPASAPGADGVIEAALEAPLAAALVRLAAGEPVPTADGESPRAGAGENPVDPAAALGLRLRRHDPVGRPGPARLELLAPGDRTEPPAPARRDLVVVGVVCEASSAFDRFGLGEGRRFTEAVRELMAALGISPRRVPFLESGRGVLVDRAQVAGARLDWIFLRADPTGIDATERAVSELLVSRGRAPLLYTNAAWSILSKPELDGYLALHDIFFWLSTGIGLAVLANLLLLAGTQRRREIALRRAEGARRRDIFGQFLAEGAILAALGIVAGILVGMGIAGVRTRLDPSVLVEPDWPWRTIAEGAAILFGGALLACVLPAWRASRHDPVELLRRL
jgi:hypothetical protein